MAELGLSHHPGGTPITKGSYFSTKAEYKLLPSLEGAVW